MEFVVEKMALGQVFIRILQFLHVSIFPRILHTNSFIHHRRYVNLIIDSVVK
jgi:branched-subunit amino acid transport protein